MVRVSRATIEHYLTRHHVIVKKSGDRQCHIYHPIVEHKSLAIEIEPQSPLPRLPRVNRANKIQLSSNSSAFIWRLRAELRNDSKMTLITSAGISK